LKKSFLLLGGWCVRGGPLMDRSKRQPEYSKMLWHAYNSGACRGRAQNQRPLSLPVSLKATIFICTLVQRSCFLLSPCAAPRSSTMVAGTGPFARTSRLLDRCFGWPSFGQSVKEVHHRGRPFLRS